MIFIKTHSSVEVIIPRECRALGPSSPFTNLIQIFLALQILAVNELVMHWKMRWNTILDSVGTQPNSPTYDYPVEAYNK